MVVHPELQFGLPTDFPVEPYVKTLGFLRRLQSDDSSEIARFRQCNLGMSGIAYRFRLLAESDEQFANLVAQYGDNPTHEHVVHRANLLFSFFLAGQASIESLAYSVHFMAASAGNSAFMADSEEAQQGVGLSSTTKLLRAHYPDSPITLSLGSLSTEAEFVQWQGIRNQAAHRHVLPTSILVKLGGEPAPAMHILEAPENTKKGVTAQEVVLDMTTTANRRQWLANRLSKLLDAESLLAEQLFHHLPARP